jgi:SAM-dependent methyltransferase
MSSDPGAPKIFDEPSLWRMEAADDLGLGADDLIAAMSPGPAFPAVLRSLAAALAGRPNVIVDLGAGTGGVSEWLRVATGATVYAVEPADGARQVARRAFPQLHVIEGRANSTSLPDHLADAVVMSGVISLMSDIGTELAEVDRILKWSGSLAIADLFSGTDVTWSREPNVFRSVDDLTRELHRHDFTVTDVGFGDPVPDPSWASVAQAVDDWIDIRCANRRGYQEWSQDRRHLRHVIESGGLLGGCVVARRTPSR